LADKRTRAGVFARIDYNDRALAVAELWSLLRIAGNRGPASMAADAGSACAGGNARPWFEALIQHG